MPHLARKTLEAGCLGKGGSCQGDVGEGVGFPITPLESDGV